jgi:8-oxo-dGTP diphosphatase
MITATTSHQTDLTFQSIKVPEVTKYQNPLPVAVALIPVQAIDPRDGLLKVGLLVGRRGIEPKLGDFALPGGYIEYEDWREAICREVMEETGIQISSTEGIKLLAVESVDQSRRLLIFGESTPISESALRQFEPTPECPEIKVLFAPELLAFESHTKIVREFFNAL